MEASDLAPNQQPTQIGRHEIVCPLGTGGMARVYLALQRGAFDATKLVVIKQLRPEFAADREFLSMFVDEARLSLRFNHANVVHMYEVLAEAPDYCLVMEYLEGQTLSQFVRRVGRERFPLDEQIWIMTQVLAGLSYAHSLQDFDGTPLGIVHRDVSPSNVFVTTQGDVKLLDFGIAKAAGAVSFTRQGIVKGKIGYAAPEQCLAQPSDARSDIYAAGVMLWEAIAMRRRTPADTQLAALRARVDDKEPPIESVVPDVHPELAEACRRSLAFDPAQRYQTAGEFQRALEAYLAGRPINEPSRALGGLLQRHFTRELSLVRHEIESRVSASGRLPTSVPSAMLSTSGAPSAVSIASGVRAADQSVSNLALVKPKHTRLYVGLGVFAAAAVAAFALSGGGDSETTNAAPSTASSIAPARAPAPEAVPSVRIDVSVSPPEARLEVDGQAVANPYRVELRKEPIERELRVTAEGYETEVHRVRFDRDLVLQLALTRDGRSKKDRRFAGTVPGARVVEPRGPALPSLPSVSAKPAAPASTKEELSPGADLKQRPSQRPSRTIDEQDPYAK
jgi:serine/threonine protein kinase